MQSLAAFQHDSEKGLSSLRRNYADLDLIAWMFSLQGHTQVKVKKKIQLHVLVQP